MKRGIGIYAERFKYLFIYEYREDSMKQIGTFRLKVVSAIDTKTLSDGTKAKYKYGSISVKTPQLEGYVGKEVMVRIFDEEK